MKVRYQHADYEEALANAPARGRRHGRPRRAQPFARAAEGRAQRSVSLRLRARSTSSVTGGLVARCRGVLRSRRRAA